jgi:hypothetical protein
MMVARHEVPGLQFGHFKAVKPCRYEVPKPWAVRRYRLSLFINGALLSKSGRLA